MFPKGPRPFSSQEEQWRGRAGPRLVVSRCVCVDAELEEEKEKLEMLEEGSCYVMRDDVHQHGTSHLSVPE